MSPKQGLTCVEMNSKNRIKWFIQSPNLNPKEYINRTTVKRRMCAKIRENHISYKAGVTLTEE